MSTDTPKTDSVSDFTVIYGAGPDTTLEYVPADFARQLERENAELRGKLERLAAQFELRPDGYVPARELRAILNEGSK